MSSSTKQGTNVPTQTAATTMAAAGLPSNTGIHVVGGHVTDDYTTWLHTNLRPAYIVQFRAPRASITSAADGSDMRTQMRREIVSRIAPLMVPPRAEEPEEHDTLPELFATIRRESDIQHTGDPDDTILVDLRYGYTTSTLHTIRLCGWRVEAEYEYPGKPCECAICTDDADSSARRQVGCKYCPGNVTNMRHRIFYNENGPVTSHGHPHQYNHGDSYCNLCGNPHGYIHEGEGDVYHLKISTAPYSRKGPHPRVRIAIIRAAPDHKVKQIRHTSKQTVISATDILAYESTTRSIGARAIEAYTAAVDGLNSGAISVDTFRTYGVQFS